MFLSPAQICSYSYIDSCNLLALLAEKTLKPTVQKQLSHCDDIIKTIRRSEIKRLHCEEDSVDKRTVQVQHKKQLPSALSP